MYSCETGVALPGEVIYYTDEMGLDFVPTDKAYTFFHSELSLNISDYLEITVKLPDTELMYVSGYFNLDNAEQTELDIPDFVPGIVRYNGDKQPQMSSPTNLTSKRAFYDKKSGWICIGEPAIKNVTEIANGTGIGILDGELLSVWLRPNIK